MKNVPIIRKLITGINGFILLVYFTVRTPSRKIIFAPFLLCFAASIGLNLGLLLNKKKMALFFDRAFKIVFFLSWFAFLVIACYIMARDHNYRMIPFTIPFWLAGIFFAKGKFKQDRKQRKKIDKADKTA